MADTFANASQTTLNGSIDSSQTSITVTSASTFPATAPYRIRVRAEGANNHEIMTVTAGAGTTTWTVVRASEPYAGSSSTSAHGNGAIVEHVLTAGVMQSLTGLAGIKLTKLGTTSAGASFATSQGLYFKKITTTVPGRIVDVFAFVKGDGSSFFGVAAGVWEDNSNAPGKLLAHSAQVRDFDGGQRVGQGGMSTTVREVHMGVSYPTYTPGTYWIGVLGLLGSTFNLAYSSGTGSDQTALSAATLSDAATSAFGTTLSTTTNDYSIGATFEEATATTGLTSSKQLLGSDTALSSDAAWHDLLTASLPSGKYTANGMIQQKATAADAYIAWRITDGTNHTAANTHYSAFPYNPFYQSIPINCPEFTLTATTTMKLQYLTGSTGNSALRYDINGSVPGTFIEFMPIPQFEPTPASVAHTSLVLDFNQGSDISGASVSAGTWTDVIANQTFTLTNPGSTIEVSVRGMIQALDTSGGDDVMGMRIIIDSAGTSVTKQIAGELSSTSGVYINPLAGTSPVFIPGLSQGSHTVKLQIYMGGGGDYYVRPSGNPPEFLAMQVIDHKNQGLSNSGVLLAETHYDPGSETQIISTSSTTSVDVDATNLKVDFVVPPSGKVLVRLSSLCDNSTSAATYYQVRESTTVLDDAWAMYGTSSLRGTTTHVITGLSPGASKTYKWGIRASSGNARLYAGAGYGDAIMEVWSA